MHHLLSLFIFSPACFGKFQDCLADFQCCTGCCSGGEHVVWNIAPREGADADNDTLIGCGADNACKKDGCGILAN